jgi:hypothetical protein
MEALIETAKIYNILEARLQHSKVPQSTNMLIQIPDLAGVKWHRVRDCLKHLVSQGKVSRVPIFGTREKIGFIWGKEAAPYTPTVKSTVKTDQEEVRLRINPDKSITIFTTKFKVIIEVPE